MPGTRGSVLIVDDELNSSSFLADLLGQEGFQAIVCATAADALNVHASERPIVVLLDWGLPDRPGIEVCREIRRTDPDVLIVFVSGRSDEASIARGFEAGADDFVTKPVRRGELVARIEAHLRRTASLRQPRAVDVPGSDSHIVRFGSIQMDTSARQVLSAGETIRLSSLEYKLLEYFVLNAGVAVSRDQILSNVYGYEADITSDRVDLLVRRLRTKLGESEQGGHISAVTGYGYRFDRRAPRDRA
jgi:DNA-binding response OmpR family regulator